MWHSNSRARGQTSLIALMLTSWLFVLAALQVRLVLLDGRALGVDEQARIRELALANAPARVLVEGPPDEGELGYYGEDPFACGMSTDTGQLIGTTHLRLAFVAREHWPRPKVVLVFNQRFSIMIQGFEE